MYECTKWVCTATKVVRQCKAVFNPSRYFLHSTIFTYLTKINFTLPGSSTRNTSSQLLRCKKRYCEPHSVYKHYIQILYNAKKPPHIKYTRRFKLQKYSAVTQMENMDIKGALSLKYDYELINLIAAFSFFSF